MASRALVIFLLFFVWSSVCALEEIGHHGGSAPTNADSGFVPSGPAPLSSSDVVDDMSASIESLQSSTMSGLDRIGEGLLPLISVRTISGHPDTTWSTPEKAVSQGCCSGFHVTDIPEWLRLHRQDILGAMLETARNEVVFLSLMIVPVLFFIVFGV